MLSLYDDMLVYIILYLDGESCVVVAHTCKRLYKLVHFARPTVLLADNAYDAVRRGLLLSFKVYSNKEMDQICYMKNITDDMLMHLYSIGEMTSVIRLYKRGIFVDAEITSHYLCRLITHAIKHNKHTLLEKLKSMSDSKIDTYCAYGYMKKGDFADMKACKIKYNSISSYHMSYSIYVRMMTLYPKISSFNGEFIVWKSPNEFCTIPHMPQCYIKRIIKYDDIDAYNDLHGYVIGFADIHYVIKYNAIKIAKRMNITGGLPMKMMYSVVYEATLDMTVEMARILLKRYGKEDIREYLECTYNATIIALLDE